MREPSSRAEKNNMGMMLRGLITAGAHDQVPRVAPSSSALSFFVRVCVRFLRNAGISGEGAGARVVRGGESMTAALRLNTGVSNPGSRRVVLACLRYPLPPPVPVSTLAPLPRTTLLPVPGLLAPVFRRRVSVILSPSLGGAPSLFDPGLSEGWPPGQVLSLSRACFL